MIADGNSVIIAARGSDESLRFYRNTDGTSTWHHVQAAGSGTTFSAPSMTTDGNSVIISARGADQSLQFYRAANSTSTWHHEQVAPPGSVA